MKKQASKLLQTLVDAGLTAEQAELSIAKAIADGSVEDDRQTSISKAIDDDEFNKALEEIAKSTATPAPAKPAEPTITEEALKIAKSAGGELKPNAQADGVDLAKMASQLDTFITKSQHDSAMVAAALPAFRDMFVVIAKGIDSMLAKVNTRIDALETNITKSAPKQAAQPVGPRSQVPGRAAPAPGDDKGQGDDNPLVIRKSVFDRITAEQRDFAKTTPARHQQLARAAAAIGGVANVEIIKSVAKDLGYSDISG